MNIKSKASTARFATEGNDEITVPKIFCRDVHDLTSLKILRRRKPLKIENMPPSLLLVIIYAPSSIRLRITTTKSKQLNPSLKYPLHPSPIMLITISIVNRIVKTTFPQY